MSEKDPRPSVWVGHVVLESDRLEETAQFMRTIGMRTIFPGPRVAVFPVSGVVAGGERSSSIGALRRARPMTEWRSAFALASWASR